MNRLSIIFFISVISLTVHSSIMATRQYIDQSINTKIQDLQENYFPQEIISITSNAIIELIPQVLEWKIPDNVASNIIFNNSNMKPTNLMLSNDPFLNNIISTNSSSFNVNIFQNITNKYTIIDPYKSIFFRSHHPGETNIVKFPLTVIFDNKLEDTLNTFYSGFISVTNYNLALSGVNNSIKIGNNIFDSIYLNLNKTNYYYTHCIGNLTYMTNNNIIIGNNISPVYFDGLAMTQLSNKPDVEDCIILAPKTADNIYKTFCGLKSSIIINVASNNICSAGCQYRFRGYYTNEYATANKLLITADNGIDDILIQIPFKNKNGLEMIYDGSIYHSLSNIIETMIINRINQMRPQ